MKNTISFGKEVEVDSIVGLIDTASVVLQRNQLDAQIEAVKSKISGIKAQIAVQQQQKINLKVNSDRVNRLLVNGAATQQQKDDVDGQMKLLDKQIEASKTQISSILKEIAVLKEQKNLINYQLSKCNIISTVSGVVLEKYINEGEIVIAGKPLMKLANLSVLDFRCYVSGEKLALVKLGEKVEIRIDSEEGTDKLEGVITWISSEAEFTPKIIQTKEERVKLVYALKVSVVNDGRLKIGMPGEMYFN